LLVLVVFHKECYLMKYSRVWGLVLLLFVSLVSPSVGDEDGPDIRPGNPTTIPDPPPVPPWMAGFVPRLTEVGTLVHGPVAGGRTEISCVITASGTEVQTVVVLYEFDRDQQQWVPLGLTPVIPILRESVIELYFMNFTVKDSTRRISFTMYDGNVPAQSLYSLPVDLPIIDLF
jgi:hypothetical protein